jgi:hypothetical protein
MLRLCNYVANSQFNSRQARDILPPQANNIFSALLILHAFVLNRAASSIRIHARADNIGYFTKVRINGEDM